MDKLIRSLHHVTATVNDAQEDLDFYVKLLGLRLVKKTVNFDNHDHLSVQGKGRSGRHQG